MAKLFITDSETSYDSKDYANKILITDSFFQICKKCSFMTEFQIQQLNESFIQLRLLQGPALLKNITEIATSLSNFNYYFSSKTNNQAIGITHILLRGFIERKFFVIALLERLLKTNKAIESIHTDLSELFSLFKEEKVDDIPVFNQFRPDELMRRRIKNQKIKNQLYFLLDVKRKLKKYPVTTNKKRVLFLIQTAEHHHELMQEVYRLTKDSENIQPVVVSYPLSLGDEEKFKRYVPEGVLLYPIQEFRGRPISNIHRKLFGSYIGDEVLDYSSAEANYTMMYNMVQGLKPSACVTVGYQDTGRFLSDICRHCEVPSISVDYSFITDDYTFEKSIEYDYKCTISEAQKNVWIKRSDPTKHHEVIGFLKYDKQEVFELDNKSFKKIHGFREDAPIIFFASSHGYDPKAKAEVISQLSQICEKRCWNLLIKKHPLERDNVAKQSILNETQKVFSHEELSANACVFYSDLVVSQGSSIVLDALYYHKSYITYSLSDSQVITDFMPIAKESFVFKAKNRSELEKHFDDILEEPSIKSLEDDMDRVREEYLFKTDGKASLRLVEFLNEIC